MVHLHAWLSCFRIKLGSIRHALREEPDVRLIDQKRLRLFYTGKNSRVCLFLVWGEPVRKPSRSPLEFFSKFSAMSFGRLDGRELCDLSEPYLSLQSRTVSE